MRRRQAASASARRPAQWWSNAASNPSDGAGAITPSYIRRRAGESAAGARRKGEVAYRKFEPPTLRFSRHALDLWRAAARCDLAVPNGGHGVTAQMLLAGKPLVVVR